MSSEGALAYRQAAVQNIGLREAPQERPIITLLNKQARYGEEQPSCGRISAATPGLHSPCVPASPSPAQQGRRSIDSDEVLAVLQARYGSVADVSTFDFGTHPDMTMPQQVRGWELRGGAGNRSLLCNMPGCAPLARYHRHNGGHPLTILIYAHAPGWPPRQVELMCNTSILVTPCGGLATVLTFMRWGGGWGRGASAQGEGCGATAAASFVCVRLSSLHAACYEPSLWACSLCAARAGPEPLP
jgi:hypothetical protein